MKTATPIYHKLVVVAKPGTKIWLKCDQWHLVQSEVGTLSTSVEHGRYFIELETPGPNGVAYPIELFGELKLTQSELESSSACVRQPPIFAEED